MAAEAGVYNIEGKNLMFKASYRQGSFWKPYQFNSCTSILTRLPGEEATKRLSRNQVHFCLKRGQVMQARKLFEKGSECTLFS